MNFLTEIATYILLAAIFVVAGTLLSQIATGAIAEAYVTIAISLLSCSFLPLFAGCSYFLVSLLFGFSFFLLLPLVYFRLLRGFDDGSLLYRRPLDTLSEQARAITKLYVEIKCEIPKVIRHEAKEYQDQKPSFKYEYSPAGYGGLYKRFHSSHLWRSKIGKSYPYPFPVHPWLLSEVLCFMPRIRNMLTPPLT